MRRYIKAFVDGSGQPLHFSSMVGKADSTHGRPVSVSIRNKAAVIAAVNQILSAANTQNANKDNYFELWRPGDIGTFVSTQTAPPDPDPICGVEGRHLISGTQFVIGSYAWANQGTPLDRILATDLCALVFNVVDYRFHPKG